MPDLEKNIEDKISDSTLEHPKEHKIELISLNQQLQDLIKGEYVIIRIRPEIIQNLHENRASPYLKKIGSNTIDLPPDYGISSIFNVSDLIIYKESVLIPNELLEPDPSLESEPQPEHPWPKFSKHDQIEKILDEQVNLDRRRIGHQRYLVHWKGRPRSKDTWMTREELHRIDLDLFEQFQSRSS